MTTATELDPIAQAARDGRPMDCLVIDSHGHIGSSYVMAQNHTDAEGIIKAMDAMGVARIAVSNTSSAVGVERQAGNDMVIDAVKNHPDRFIGYCVLFPDDARANLDELQRCDAQGVHAVKIHSYHGKPYTDPTYRAAFEYANKRHMPILAHTWGSEHCDYLLELAADYPDATWLAGHSPIDANAYVALAEQRANVFLEVCYSLAPYGLVEFYVQQLGAGRILFGSDCAYNSLSPSLGRVAMSDISVADKIAILGRNAKAVFSLSPDR